MITNSVVISLHCSRLLLLLLVTFICGLNSFLFHHWLPALRCLLSICMFHTSLDETCVRILLSHLPAWPFQLFHIIIAAAHHGMPLNLRFLRHSSISCSSCCYCLATCHFSHSHRVSFGGTLRDRSNHTERSTLHRSQQLLLSLKGCSEFDTTPFCTKYQSTFASIFLIPQIISQRYVGVVSLGHLLIETYLRLSMSIYLWFYLTDFGGQQSPKELISFTKVAQFALNGCNNNCYQRNTN